MLTPIDIETAEFKKVALGYAPDAVDEFLNKVIEEFEVLYKENTFLREKLKNTEETIKHYKSMEDSIKSSILLAEKASSAAKTNAAEQAENIIKAAQAKADEKIIEAANEKARLESAITQLKSRYAMLTSGIRGLINAELEYLNNSEELLNDMTADEAEIAAAKEKQPKTPEKQYVKSAAKQLNIR